MARKEAPGFLKLVFNFVLHAGNVLLIASKTLTKKEGWDGDVPCGQKHLSFELVYQVGSLHNQCVGPKLATE